MEGQVPDPEPGPQKARRLGCGFIAQWSSRRSPASSSWATSGEPMAFSAPHVPEEAQLVIPPTHLYAHGLC